MSFGKAALIAAAMATGTIASPYSNTRIPAEAAGEARTASEADMTFFYKSPSPERVKTLIVYFDMLARSGKPYAQPPIIGFLAAALQRYPNDINKIIPGGLSATMQGIMAASLRLAGQDAKAQSLADHLRATGAPAPDLENIPPSLDAVTATAPGDFDLLWGASFASGDPRYCLKILDRFAAVANVDGNADDMVTIARSYGTGADFQWLVKKRGTDKAGELIAQSTALWSLNSNAQQHDFVHIAVANYRAAHPAEPASKALAALAQEYGHYDLKNVLSLTETAPGKPSVTVNVAYFTQLLDDLSRHAGTYPPHFEFPEDRQRAEHDVITISGLLDPQAQNFSHSPPILLRLALLHTIGYNLDIPDSHEKAVTSFSALLALTPIEPQANYQYGAFLAATTRKGEGIPYLEKAKSLGVPAADYWLGLSYEAIGDKAKAVENLQSYTTHFPGDLNAARLLDAVRNDHVKLEERKSVP